MYVNKTKVVADIEKRLVRNVDLSVFDVPAPCQHPHVCPLAAALAAQYALYRVYRNREIRADSITGVNIFTFVDSKVFLVYSNILSFPYRCPVRSIAF